MHKRQYGFTEEFKIRREIEKGDLDPVTANTFEADQLIDDGLRAANDLNVAAQRTVRVAMSLPGDGIAVPLMGDKAVDRAPIRRIENGLMIPLRLAVGFSRRSAEGDTIRSIKASPDFIATREHVLGLIWASAG